MAELSRDEILRYSRHLLLPEVTLEGQKRLRAARSRVCPSRVTSGNSRWRL